MTIINFPTLQGFDAQEALDEYLNELNPSPQAEVQIRRFVTTLDGYRIDVAFTRATKGKLTYHDVSSWNLDADDSPTEVYAAAKLGVHNKLKPETDDWYFQGAGTKMSLMRQYTTDGLTLECCGANDERGVAFHFEGLAFINGLDVVKLVEANCLPDLRPDQHLSVYRELN